MFDAPAYLKTIEAPVFVDQTGKTHVGRILGADQWMHLQSKMRAKKADGTIDAVALNASMWRLVNAVFPRPWWTPWRRSVAWHVWQLPLVGRMRAVWDFMQSQAKGTGFSIPTSFPGMNQVNEVLNATPDAPSPDSQTSG